MRMWMLPPRVHCRKHLLGAHVECHMLAGAIRSGMDISGWVRLGFVDPSRVQEYHDEIAAEMVRRGYNHMSPLSCVLEITGCIDPEKNRIDLHSRCRECNITY